MESLELYLGLNRNKRHFIKLKMKIMKRILFVLTMMIGLAFTTQAQRFCYCGYGLHFKQLAGI